MIFFAWQKNYAFGIESIDNDHVKLVDMINNLYSAMSKGDGRSVIQDIVTGLVDYSKVHFKREEVKMKSINYKNFNSHEAEHDDFITKVSSFKKKLDEGRDNISIEVVTFLREWLSNHILTSDKEMALELIKHQTV
jgi:hemerythrin